MMKCAMPQVSALPKHTQPTAEAVGLGCYAASKLQLRYFFLCCWLYLLPGTAGLQLSHSFAVYTLITWQSFWVAYCVG